MENTFCRPCGITESRHSMVGLTGKSIDNPKNRKEQRGKYYALRSLQGPYVSSKRLTQASYKKEKEKKKLDRDFFSYSIKNQTTKNSELAKTTKEHNERSLLVTYVCASASRRSTRDVRTGSIWTPSAARRTRSCVVDNGMSCTISDGSHPGPSGMHSSRRAAAPAPTLTGRDGDVNTVHFAACARSPHAMASNSSPREGVSPTRESQVSEDATLSLWPP